MKKNVLMRTNLLVCIVIICGFIVTSIISYRSNRGIFHKDIESVTALTSEGIYHQIDSIFIKPVNISLTMANDSLLKGFLTEETAQLDNAEFVENMRAYLNAYREKYDYDSVFLASAQTNRYYYFNGVDRTLLPDDPENVWFYDFLQSDAEYTLNIDNDQVDGAGNEITVFVNCRIMGTEGETIGIVGVGFRVKHLQELFQEYENNFGVNIDLIDRAGTVQISTEQSGYVAVNLFDNCIFPELKDSILKDEYDTKTFWHSSNKGSGYLVSAYVKNLDWYLLVEHDTTVLDQQITRQFMRELLIILLIVALVLVIITSVIRKYNKQIIELTVMKEQEHLNAFQKATEHLYENIYEIDITHNRAASEATEEYFVSLGAPNNTTYGEALKIIAEKQIKEEYRQGYIDTFSPESVLKAFGAGAENLRYDFMIRTDGENYYWMRIIAQLFHWDDDDSVRMLVYRQNIDEEKRRELYLYDRMQKDSLTGLYNKAATQENIRAALLNHPQTLYAFYILDVDNFKRINDRFGHATGDTVLVEFAHSIQAQFQSGDIVGRIGGDEFAAFCPVADMQEAERKAQELVNILHRKIAVKSTFCEITASIGVAAAPQAGSDFETLYRNADTALYQTKGSGKNGYTIFREDGAVLQ